MIIEHQLTRETLRFTRRPPLAVRMPYIRATVSSPGSNKGANLSQRFLIDTGAALTVLNKYWAPLFEHTIPLDMLKIQYGRLLKTLPVYNALIYFQGYEFNTEVVLDVDLALNHSLLGWHRFLNDQFEFMYFRTKRADKSLKFRLIKIQQD